MLTDFVKSVYNYFLSSRDQRVPVKRKREESDDSEPGELAKRLCSMTEKNMAGGRSPLSRNRQDKLPTVTAPDTDVEVLVQASMPGGERRICSPRRPGRRLTDPPQQTLLSEVRQVPIVVEKADRAVPIVVERRPTALESRRQPSARTALAPASTARASSETDDEVVVIGQKKINGNVGGKGKGTSGGDFVGLRSFRQMVETGRVAGRDSPFKRQQQQQQQQQRSPKQQSLYDKLIGIAPSKKNIRRGIAATLNCFRLDEKQRYQQLLSGYARSASPPASLVDVSSFRTKSLLASTPMESTPAAALRRDRLGRTATARLTRRVSLVDLVSSGSESSAAGAAGAGPPPLPPTVVLSGSEAGSQPASVVSDDDSVRVEKVVPAPPRRKTQLDDEIGRHLKHFTELRAKYAASERDRQRQIAEERRRGAISRDNHAEWERGLTLRLRRQMRLTQRVALEAEPEEEEEEEEEVMAELTPEMEGVISAALRPSPPTELMSEAFNQRITRHDLQTLKGLNWLNDEVINFYMNMLMERSKSHSKLPKVYCFNTFFYGKIVGQGHSSVRRWTRKVDIFDHDLLMIPVHLGMHWCMACVDLRRKAVRYFDSMHGDNNRGLDAILRYLRDEHADKKKQPLDTSDWQAVNEKEIPQQMNGSDCGMFACKFAEYLSRDARITFTQEHMPYFRRRLVYEIVTKALL